MPTTLTTPPAPPATLAPTVGVPPIADTSPPAIVSAESTTTPPWPPPPPPAPLPPSAVAESSSTSGPDAVTRTEPPLPPAPGLPTPASALSWPSSIMPFAETAIAPPDATGAPVARTVPPAMLRPAAIATRPPLPATAPTDETAPARAMSREAVSRTTPPFPPPAGAEASTEPIGRSRPRTAIEPPTLGAVDRVPRASTSPAPDTRPTTFAVTSPVTTSPAAFSPTLVPGASTSEVRRSPPVARSDTGPLGPLLPVVMTEPSARLLPTTVTAPPVVPAKPSPGTITTGPPEMIVTFGAAAAVHGVQAGRIAPYGPTLTCPARRTVAAVMLTVPSTVTLPYVWSPLREMLVPSGTVRSAASATAGAVSEARATRPQSIRRIATSVRQHSAARDGENARVSCITTVVFDLNGTLTDPADDPLRATFHPAVAALLGIDPAAYAAHLGASYASRATGAFATTRAMLADAATCLGGTPDAAALERATAERLRQFGRLLEPRAGALETLAALTTGGYRLGLVSDCSCETVELWDALPYARFIEQPVFSCSFGARKPTPAIYHEACRRLDAAPADCAFVGDGGSRELTGARAVGMHAVRLRNDHVAGAREHRVDPDDGFDGPSIGDLRELPGYLAGLADG